MYEIIFNDHFFLMKRVFIFLLALMFASTIFGQSKKVAMIEPSGEVTAMQKSIVRATLAEAITEAGGYEAFTRADVDQIAREYKFQDGGMITDKDRKEINLKGVDMLCITKLTVESGYFFVEAMPRSAVNVRLGG